MRLILRAVISLLAGVMTYFFALWPVAAGIALVAGGGQTAARWTGLIAPVAAVVCAAAMVRYMWRETGPSAKGSSQHRFILRGAVLLGLISFAAGFFGPIMFAPQSNQGPLLGIIFTGPLGALVGAIAGDLYWRFRRK